MKFTYLCFLFLMPSSIVLAQPFANGQRSGSVSAYSDSYGYRIPRSPYNFGRNYRGYGQGYRSLYGARIPYKQIPQSSYNFGRNYRGYGQGYRSLRARGLR